MSEAGIPFTLYYEADTDNAEFNGIKIQYEGLPFMRCYLGYFKFWILVLSEIFQYLRRGCSSRFIIDFIGNAKHTVRRSEYLRKLINKMPDAILYAYFFDDIAVSMALASSQATNKVVTISRTHGFETYDEQAPYQHIPFQAYKLRHIDCIFPVSKQGARHLQQQIKDDSTHIKAMYLGSDPHERNNPLPTDLSIVSCAYVRSIKRLDLVPEVLKKINRPVTWTLIGDGEDLPLIRQLCNDLPDHIKVVFKGNLSQQEIYALYATQGFSCFLSVSATEGLPISIMEAISFGIPAIATNVGGCSEIVTTETGVLIDKAFDTSALATIIEQFEKSEMTTNAYRQQVKQFWNANFNAINNYQLFKNQLNKC